MLMLTNYNISPELLQQAQKEIPNIDFKFTINTPTGNFFYDRWEIKPEFRGSVWEKIINALPTNIGETRLIVLKPASCYHVHGDIDDRYHLNITGDHSYIVDLTTNILYQTYQDGRWYEMDAGPIHSAVNFGVVDRVQLVARKLLTVNTLQDPIRVSIVSEELKEDDARFLFDNSLSTWLNKANKNKIISNFSYSNSKVTFDVDNRYFDELEKIIPNKLRLII